MRFSISGQWKWALFPVPYMLKVLFPLILSYGSFPVIWWLPFSPVVIRAQVNTPGSPSADLTFSLWYLFPHWYSDLETSLPTLPAMSPQLRENVRLYLGIFSWCCSLETAQEVSWWLGLTEFVSCFSEIIVICCPMSYVLKAIVSCILSRFWLIQECRSIHFLVLDINQKKMSLVKYT